MLFAMQKDSFLVLEHFCRELHVRASMHKITSFRASKNTNALFSATKQKKRKQGHRCWKASSQWEKVGLCNLGVKLKYYERCLFLMN